LKDEVRSSSKNEYAKTRVFCAGAFETLVISKQFLGALFVAMQTYGEAFGTRIGINCHSIKETATLFEQLERCDNIVEGDYSSYDTNMPFDITYACNELIMRLAKYYGFTDSELVYFCGCLTDSLFPIYACEGVLFSAPGTTPSGEYGTAERNSLKGLLLIIYGFLKLKPIEVSDLSFGDLFYPITYGDDVLLGVSHRACSWFDARKYQRVMQEIGLDFTDSNKRSVISPFTPFNEISFLKRRFCHSPIVNGPVMKLDINSILKMLVYVMPSPHVTVESQYINIVQSAVRELFFHCDSEETFSEIRYELATILASTIKADSDYVLGLLPDCPRIMEDIGYESFQAQSSVSGDVCLICHELNGALQNQKAYCSKCKKCFHISCIEQLIQHDSRCPACRRRIVLIFNFSPESFYFFLSLEDNETMPYSDEEVAEKLNQLFFSFFGAGSTI
jgi:hypothetical protein